MKLRRLAILILSLSVILAGFTFPSSSARAEQEWYSGRGTLEWTFDEETGTLTITNTDPQNRPTSIMGFNFYDNPGNPGSAWSRAPWYEEYHEKIKKVVIGPNIPAASGCCFCDCPNLEIADIRYASMIGHEAFRDCPKLTTLILSNNITGVHYGAFQDCTGLTSLTITGNLDEIGDRAFKGCTSLTTLTIPDSVWKIGDDAFVDCPKLRNFTLPASLAYIGSRAFAGRTDLTSVVFPEILQYIGECAFSGCTGLTSLAFPESLLEIYDGAFMGCSNLQTVSFPINLTRVGDEAFMGCSRLKSAVFTGALEAVGASAFDGCTALTSVSFPARLQEIGEAAFTGCTNLETVNFPESLTSIGSGAFSGCTKLKKAEFSGSLQVIGSFAFESCTGLTSVTLPASLLEIGQQAFAFCSLSSVSVAAGTETAVWDFFSPETDYSKNYVYHVTLPASVRSVGCAAFYGNLFPHSVPKWTFTVPSEVTEITADSFSGTNPRYVRLQVGVTSIGDNAFAACSNLEYVYVPYTCQTFGVNAFPEGTGLLMDGYLSYDDIPSEIMDYVNDNHLKLRLVEDPNSGNG